MRKHLERRKGFSLDHGFQVKVSWSLCFWVSGVVERCGTAKLHTSWWPRSREQSHRPKEGVRVHQVGEMTQQFKSCDGLTEDPSMVPSSCVGQLIIGFNSSPRGSVVV